MTRAFIFCEILEFRHDLERFKQAVERFKQEAVYLNVLLHSL